MDNTDFPSQIINSGTFKSNNNDVELMKDETDE